MAEIMIVRGISKNDSEVNNGIQGFNFILNRDTFIDLEHNIPYIYSDVNAEHDEDEDTQMKKGKVSNTKKIFSDSSRFLSPYKRE